MSENASRGLKVALGIAVALIIAVGAYAFTLHKDSKEMEMSLTEQREQLINDLLDYLEIKLFLYISNLIALFMLF